MSPKERAEQALILLRQSEEEFAKNDIFQGSEKPWVAATQAVLAIASRETGEEPHTRREMKRLVMKLAETYESPNLALQFAVAEGFTPTSITGGKTTFRYKPMCRRYMTS